MENYMKLRIAFLQILPTGFLNGNLEKGIKACREAKAKGADIAIFPEMWSCGYDFPHEEESVVEHALLDFLPWHTPSAVRVFSAWKKNFRAVLHAGRSWKSKNERDLKQSSVRVAACA